MPHFDAPSDMPGDIAMDVGDAPVDVPVDIAAGYYPTCARRVDGAVFCWGYDGLGQLGDGSMVPQRRTPAAVVAF